ncbi:hypothetical protein ACVR05_03870 [Streptococcus caprae]|uniref:Uncharacterized protein n=1 Tax=Streptococcus caprae TaxID=1640501 RepID=A0ABV8CZ70_9STRE
MRLFQFYRLLTVLRFVIFLLTQYADFQTAGWVTGLDYLLIPLSIFGFMYFLEHYEQYGWKIWYFFIPIWVPVHPKGVCVD